MNIKPKKLEKKDKVAVVSLSRGLLGMPFCKHELDIGLKRLEEYSLIPVIMNNSLKDMDYLQDAGVIIENPGFISYYSGLKNLKLLAGLNGKKDTAHLSRVMELCGLDPGLRLPVRKYSLGMRQRLGIAQAIMDEPMNGLDKRGVEDVRKLLLQLKEQGKLILIASHNKADIDILCDEVYEMESGVLHKIYG